jgi:hypothetical protein
LKSKTKFQLTKGLMMIEFSSMKEMPSALSKLQFAVRNPQRTKKAFNYFYADMDEVLECIKKPCSDHGFSVIQMPFNHEDILGVETLLIHSSGEYIKGKFGSKLAKQDPQSVGSQISYYRRYSILSMFNLSQEDDDGATVSKPQAQQESIATDKQKVFLHRLIMENNIVLEQSHIEKLKLITSTKCSEAIKSLQEHNKSKFFEILG